MPCNIFSRFHYYPCSLRRFVNYYYTVVSVDGGREPFMQNW